MAVLIYMPINSLQEFFFLHIFANIILNNSHSTWGETITHYSFDLYFPDG
jgi:hypothetical protein